MLGQDVRHEEVPLFYSDLADWVSFEYVGPGTGEPTIRGSLDDGSFTAFYVEDGKVTAALSVDRDESELEAARRYLREGSSPEPSVLADEGSELG